MKPKKSDNNPDLFRSQLCQILNMSHPLVRLSERIGWSRLESELDELYTSGAGQPPLPTRLLVGLHYLKYAFDESDESVVERWVENPYWQYFCGYEYLQHELPLHPTSLVKWRHRVGDKLEVLLGETIELAKRGGLLKLSEFRHVNVDTTVQEKAMAFPTDARLYDKARGVLVREAKRRGITLRQSYVRVGKRALLKQSRYAHASQMKRARGQTRKLKTYLGRVIRDVERKAVNMDSELSEFIGRAKRIHTQQRHDKDKLYSMHAPEVKCIAKGKAHKRYEFGNKVALAATSKNNWIISAVSHRNPYDGHTLNQSIEQIKTLTQHTPAHVYCDRGYRGHDYTGQAKVHVVNKLPKRLTRTMKRWYKRRACIEPTIGHLKSDYRMNRNYLKGEIGDRINAVLAAAGYNFVKLLAEFYRVCKHSRYWINNWFEIKLIRYKFVHVH